MKHFLSAVLVMLLAATYGANLIPGGDLSVTTGKCPKPRKSGTSKAFYQKGETGNKIMVEVVSTKETPIIDMYGVSGLKSGTQYFFRIDFHALEQEAGANVSARISFYDEQKKKVRDFFTPKFFINDSGKQEMIYSFNAPRGAVSASIAVFFNGIQKTEVNSLSLDTEFPLLADGNAIWNGSFETPAMNGIRTVSLGNKDKKMFFERSTAKALSGKYSLLCASPLESGNNEVSFNTLPYRDGAKYRFKVNYFIASGEGKIKVAGRISFLDQKGKEIRNIFPSAPAVAGKWEKMEREFFPPAGTAKIRVTLWLVGKMQIYLDDIYFGEVREEKMENRSSGAALLESGKAFKLWKEAPYLKVAYTGVPEGIQPGKEITVSAAANESEPFQLVLTPDDNLPEVHLAFSDLAGSAGIIPAGSLASRVVGFINLKNPDIPSMKGWNADPILPESQADAVKGRNLPFFVSVNVPKNQKAGVYKGTFRVMSGEKELAKVPLTVRVRNFALPDIAHLRTYFYGQPQPAYRSIDKRSWQEIADDIQRINFDHRMNGNQAINLAAPVCKIENGRLIVTDWSAFDANVERWHKNYGMVNMPVPYFPMLGFHEGWSGGDRSRPRKIPFADCRWNSPEGLKYMGEFARQFTEHVKEKFPHISFYAYMYDEPKADSHAELQNITNAVHQAAPDLKIFITKDSGGDVGYIHTLCSPLSPGLIDFKKHSEIMKNGGDVWFYNWQVHMDNHRYIMSRLYPWMIYSIDGNGGLLWNTISTRTNVNPWHDMEKTYLCGAATIFYPPRKAGEGLISSLRAQQIRESIDDFDYMRILEKKIDHLYPGQGKVRVKEIIRALIPVFPFDYKNDPHLLYDLRTRLADEIEALDTEPKAVIVSTPSENVTTELSSVKFHIFAPAGSRVAINGKAAGTVGNSKRLDVPFNLDRSGENKVKLEITLNGVKKTFFRTFTRKPDPQLKTLKELAAKCRKQNVDASKINAFLKRAASGGAYTEAMRSEAAKLLQSVNLTLVEKAISKDGRSTFANPLEKAVFARAKAAFDRKQFERAEYYLALSNEVGKAGRMGSQKVKISAVDYSGHAGFVLDNGIIQATVLETGGRIISFKVKGVECLSPGSFANALSVWERAAQKVTKDMVSRLHGYGGYEDAGGRTLWPISFVDWDVEFLLLKADRISLKFTVRLPDSPFKISRTVTMNENSGDLKMGYEFVNVMPEGIKSDDPEHYQLSWRGRFVPAIGENRENDTLIVPAKYEKDALPEKHFSANNPVKYEKASIRLKAPYMGVFDAGSQTGLAVIGDSQITHAYVWFDSKGSYTLEFPRSFFGKSADAKETNAPFSIEPGQSRSFSLIMRGISGVTGEADFIAKAGL